MIRSGISCGWNNAGSGEFLMNSLSHAPDSRSSVLRYVENTNRTNGLPFPGKRQLRKYASTNRGYGSNTGESRQPSNTNTPLTTKMIFQVRFIILIYRRPAENVALPAGENNEVDTVSQHNKGDLEFKPLCGHGMNGFRQSPFQQTARGFDHIADGSLKIASFILHWAPCGCCKALSMHVINQTKNDYNLGIHEFSCHLRGWIP